jgi:hypothetical protein
MDTEDLLPRLALFGGLAAALIVYRRSRAGKLKDVQAAPAGAPGAAAAGSTSAGVDVVGRGPSPIEGLLDKIAEQALDELKKVLKDGLRRLDKIIDDL